MLTDVVMPGMTGKELADRLRPLRPEMAVVFMSGYLESGTGALNGRGGFSFQALFSQAMAKKVREVLGPPRSAGKMLVIDDKRESGDFFERYWSRWVTRLWKRITGSRR